MEDPRERYLRIFREIPTVVTFALVVGDTKDGQGGTPLRKVREQLGDEFDVTDPSTKQTRHVSLAHLSGNDPDQTTISWRWGYRPKLPLSPNDAQKWLNHNRALGLKPSPDAERHLTARAE